MLTPLYGNPQAPPKVLLLSQECPCIELSCLSSHLQPGIVSSSFSHLFLTFVALDAVEDYRLTAL